MELEFTINAKEVQVDVDPDMRALDLIRDVLGLTGTKEGCGRGECGACTILVDGVPVSSCLMYAPKLNGKTVLTIEGLGEGEDLHPIQKAFLDEGAVQCGFCTPGMIMSAKALLDRTEDPTEDEIEEAISGNICRCTGYSKIVKAIKRASEEKRDE
jgi:carbon-monoxide dehydrogenase small subunit